MKLKIKKHFEVLVFFPFIVLGLVLIYLFNLRIEEFKSSKEKFEESIKREKIKTKINLVSENNKTESFNIVINDSVISPRLIEVDKGSMVIFNINVSEGYHSLFIDRYNFESRGIPTGQSDQLIFVASMSGRFNLSSSTDLYIKEPEEAVLIVK